MPLSDASSESAYALVEGLALRSLSDWLQVGTRHINMSQAQCVEDDSESRPRELVIWFQGHSCKARGADRVKILAWLAEQVSPELGAPGS